MSGKKGSAESADEVDRGTHRVEGFSDGFFAIVITLLVIDLHLPEESSLPLTEQLRDLWPVVAAYLISFLNIYILWVAHHELMRIATRADTSFLYLNGLLLLGVAVMPFSTAMLADHFTGEDARIAAAVFTGVLAWTALWLNLLWRYLAHEAARLMPSVGAHDRDRISRTYLVTLALYVMAFAISWMQPLWSVLITSALAIFFAVADRLSGFASEDVTNESP
ncbi:MAG: TMEM175 family protein [Terricaulis sp.]